MQSASARKSVVAGILGPKGFRCVVTEPYLVHCHLTTPGEQAFVVPDLFVDEPVPWDLIPFVISCAETYARRMWGRNDPAPLEGDLWGHPGPVLSTLQQMYDRGLADLKARQA